MNERTKVWTDRFKQLHPRELQLIGVRANIVEPKDALISEENGSGLCYSVHKYVLWFIVTEAAWGPLNACPHLNTGCVVFASFDRDIIFTDLELILSEENKNRLICRWEANLHTWGQMLKWAQTKAPVSPLCSCNSAIEQSLTFRICFLQTEHFFFSVGRILENCAAEYCYIIKILAFFSFLEILA